MSWNLGKGDEFLPGISLAELKNMYKKEKNAKPKQRLLCAIHRKQGESIDAIGGIMEMHKRTVHDILRRFDERGVSAKDSIKQSGRPPLIAEKQRKELARELEAGPPYNKSGLWTTKEVRDLLKRKYGLVFVNQHVWRIITSLGFTMQRPRKRHYKKASDEEIAVFKKSRGVKQGTTGRKALSWAQKMKPPLA
jgi:transposase